MSAGQILRALMELGVVPANAEMDRRGRASWRDGELDLIVHLVRALGGRLAWYTFVCDAKLGPALADHGRLAVRLQAVDETPVAWPSGPRLDDGLRELLSALIRESLRFVRDRADLAAILASDGDVRRGGVTTWLPAANYPSRLVGALVIARDIQSAELERDIRARLDSGPRVLPDGRQVDVKAQAARWAAEYEKVLGVLIPV